MRRKVEGILASIGAAVCVSVAGFYWLSPSCPVPALVLLDVALLGLAGVATALLHIRGYYYQWGWVIWCVCGGLAAATIIGVWSRSEERRVGKECRSRWATDE